MYNPLKSLIRCTASVIMLTIVVFSTQHTVQATQSPIVSKLKTVECAFDLSGIETQNTIDCYTLAVPEDRTVANSKDLQLYIAVIRSTSDNPVPDPVVYLEGGPGGSAVDGIADWLESPILENRDLVLLDQRGTGYSEPGLFCPESTQTDDEVESVRKCHDYFVKKGVNLSAFNSIESAADVDAVREALGYKTWNLYGISYGTRLALFTLRDFPQSVRSLIIDGVYPPEVEALEEELLALRPFELLFKKCAADASCNAAYPDLKTIFYDSVSKLNETPAEWNGPDAETGENVDQSMTGDEYFDRIFNLFYATEAIPHLPKVMFAVAQGDYEALSNLEAGTPDEGKPGRPGFVLRQDGGESDRSDADAMFNSVECGEEVAFSSRDKAIAAVQTAPELLKGKFEVDIDNQLETCKIWNVKKSPVKADERVESDRPALIFSGEYDPVTPESWAESAAKGLPNHFSFTFPDAGHGQVNDCASQMINDFLDDPTQQPDGSCVKDQTQVFITN